MVYFVLNGGTFFESRHLDIKKALFIGKIRLFYG
jgi:hypothetical protein